MHSWWWAAGLTHSRDTPSYERFREFAYHHLNLYGDPEKWPQQLLAAAFEGLYVLGDYYLIESVPFTDDDVKNAGRIGPDNALEMAFYPLRVRARRTLPDTPLPGDEAFGDIELLDGFSFYGMRTTSGMLKAKK